MSLVEQIAERQRKLLSAGQELKEHFVGIDAVIDRILHHVSAWYCAPEILSRPTTVCLWGLTGVGKTDLVRRFAKGIGMQDAFVEMQMTNKGSSQHVYSSTMQGVLGDSNIDTNKPGILLLDEIQRFRAKDEEGKDIHDYKFQDLWMLLSDGSFGGISDNKNRLLEMLIEDQYNADYMAACHDVGMVNKEDRQENEQQKRIQEKRKFKMGLWTAKQMKRQLRLSEPLEEIMTWDSRKKIELVEEKMSDQSIYDAEVYQQLLIFISGNLDEAYQMAGMTGETDVDADIFHNHSLNINLLRIKKALNSRFKPEQIARFGNSHVVYPSLSRKSYEEIIKRRMKTISDLVKEKSGITVTVDQTVYDAIYRNGVFPVQGTRPVFSTITSFFEAVMPQFMFACLSCEQSDVSLYYKDKHLCAEIDGKPLRVKNEGDVDKVKEDNRNEDLITKVAVHEAGHAVVYALLFGICPTQCTANAAKEDSNGFMGLHKISDTPDSIRNTVRVLMAGRCAELQVFGKNHVGSGAWGDLSSATAEACNYYRLYGMGDTLARVAYEGNQQAGMNSVNNYDEQTEDVEDFLQTERNEAVKLLKEHSDLLRATADYLIEHEEFDLIKDPQPFIGIFADHGVKELLELLDENDPMLAILGNQTEEWEEKAKIDELRRRLWDLKHKIEDRTVEFVDDSAEPRWAVIENQIDFEGKTVLDIGSFDGYFSFKAEAAGAKSVLATDKYVWFEAPTWSNSKLHFNEVKEALDSGVKEKVIDPKDINKVTVGTFDVVFLLGVIYHRVDFYTVFENAAEVCDEHLLVSTHIDPKIDPDRPAFVFYPNDEFHKDHTNWFVPNRMAVVAMFDKFGFEITHEEFVGENSVIFVGKRR
ncbi:ftsH [Symbiodinium microadriaticum]|nr:ftsH [Symbiodinium microadriaticum]